MVEGAFIVDLSDEVSERSFNEQRWLLVFGFALLGIALFLVNPIEESPKYGRSGHLPPRHSG